MYCVLTEKISFSLNTKVWLLSKQIIKINRRERRRVNKLEGPSLLILIYAKRMAE
jgi:hypothetical protein